MAGATCTFPAASVTPLPRLVSGAAKGVLAQTCSSARIPTQYDALGWGGPTCYGGGPPGEPCASRRDPPQAKVDFLRAMATNEDGAQLVKHLHSIN